MPRHRVVAKAYDKRGRLLAMGYNSYKRTHRLQAYYSTKVGRPKAIYLHAELNVLLKARSRGRVYKLVVERFGKRGQPLCAAPCEACQLAIQDFGVVHVEHT